MFIAMNDMKDPIQIQRKSRICNVSNMGDASTEFMRLLRAGAAIDTVTLDGGGGAVTVEALVMFWAKLFGNYIPKWRTAREFLPIPRPLWYS